MLTTTIMKSIFVWYGFWPAPEGNPGYEARRIASTGQNCHHHHWLCHRHNHHHCHRHRHHGHCPQNEGKSTTGQNWHHQVQRQRGKTRKECKTAITTLILVKAMIFWGRKLNQPTEEVARYKSVRTPGKSTLSWEGMKLAVITLHPLVWASHVFCLRFCIFVFVFVHLYLCTCICICATIK